MAAQETRMLFRNIDEPQLHTLDVYERRGDEGHCDEQAEEAEDERHQRLRDDRQRRRQVEHLWFGLLALCFSANTFASSFWVYEVTGQYDVAVRASDLTGHLLAMLAIQFLWTFFSRPISRPLRAYQLSHGVLALFVALWPEVRLVVASQSFRSLWLLEKQPLITGEALESAVAATDPQFGRPVVNFELSRRGGRTFGRETGRNIGKQMAIVLDEQVYTAPVIRGQISRNGQIELGQSTLEEAADLALVLRAGALPAPLRVVEERSVGPSLGEDSVRKGFIAGLIGLAGVVVIMIGYYRLAGVLAVIALSLYSLYTLGALAAMDAVLTFPGIAGLVLSIGMSVDANVLIFERIREELEAGRAVRPAVSEGFKQALSAIVDSNITTLLTAAILYYVGTGPIQGFAVTLGLGIVISMFTAIFVTRTLFTLYLERRSPAAQGLSI